MRLESFSYEHNVRDERIRQYGEATASQLPSLGEHAVTKRYSDGLIVDLDHPFGAFTTISAFGGENIYTIQTSGGHGFHGLITVQRPDDEITTFKLDDRDQILPILRKMQPTGLFAAIASYFGG